MTKAEKRALIIGVSDYNNELPHLEFCTKDGQALYELLKSQGYSIPDEYILTGKVNFDKLRDTILGFFTNQNIKPTDTLLFYFSGHGVPDEYGNNYLAASDIDPDLPLGRGLSFKDLKSIADMSISTRIVSVLDCCYAGAAVSDGKGSNANVDAKLARDAIERIVPGRCVLASSQAYQESYGQMESGHSLFTYYLLDGLRGGKGESVDEDGNITTSKLSGYIYDSIMSLPHGKRPSQRPITKIGEGGGDLILANYPEMGSRRGTKTDRRYLLKLLEQEKIEEFNKIREKEDGVVYLHKVNLSGKNLRGVDLHEADLTEAILVDTILTMTNLNGAKLKGADLSGADLRSADFYGASLAGANLTRADLRGADLKGMIDFAGANLTGADVRGVDLTGMVNFAGAKLHDVDFTGSVTDKGLINFAGADVHNARGLPVLQERNEYLEGLKSFSEAVTQQFKDFDIPVEQVMLIEESMNNLVEEIRDIHKLREIDEVKKKKINSKFVQMVERVISALGAKKADTPGIFTSLTPFAKITGEIPVIVKTIQKIHSTTNENDTGPVYQHPGPSPQPLKTIGSPVFRNVIGSEKDTGPVYQHPGPSPQPLKTIGSPVFQNVIGSEKDTGPVYQHPGPSPQPLKTIGSPVFQNVIGSEKDTGPVYQHPGPSPQPLKTIGSPVFRNVIGSEKDTGPVYQHPSESMREEQALSRSPISSPYALDQASRKTPEEHLASSVVRKKQQLISNRKLIIPIIAAIISSMLAYVFFSGTMLPSQSTNHAIVIQSPLPSQNIRNNAFHVLSAIGQSITTNRDTPVSITLAGTDPDKSDSLTAAIVTTPSHGSLSKINQVTGMVTYTPDRGFSGQDKFTFKVNNGRADSYNVGTVSITINQLPFAAIGQSITTNRDTPVSITLAGTDPDKSDSLTAAIVTTPSHGSLSKINQVTGMVTYTPDRGFSGQDKFTFKVNNGRADSYNVGTVFITIT